MSGSCNPYNGSQYDYSKSLDVYKPALVQSDETLSDAITNLNNLVQYSNAITGADGRKPEGGKYFWSTGGTCDSIEYTAKSKGGISDAECETKLKSNANDFNDKCTIEERRTSQQRFGYIDNAISGPAYTAGSIGGGLLSGAAGNIMDVNGKGLVTSLLGSSNPKCTAVTLEVVDKDGCVGPAGPIYVADNDIADISPCNFPTGINPITNATCMGGFTNIDDNDKDELDNYTYLTDITKIPNSKIDKLFLTSFTLFLFYLLYKLNLAR